MPRVTLEEPLFLFVISKINVALSTVLTSVAVYLIITRSSEMKMYRWFLLNFVVSCDFHIPS